MMDVTRHIQIAVARADLIVCSMLRWLAVVVPLVVLFLFVLLVVWANRPDPYLIDYNAPGVDITSEGPEDGNHWHDQVAQFTNDANERGD